jgi:hypothetical protein
MTNDLKRIGWQCCGMEGLGFPEKMEDVSVSYINPLVLKLIDQCTLQNAGI